MNWKDELNNNVSTLTQLKKYVDLDKVEIQKLEKVIKRHPMFITKYYISLINFDEPADPIKKMIIPSRKELNLSGSYDTSGEKESTKMPGLQHKYNQTVLMLVTNKCTSYCRYCFRKRLVGIPTKDLVERFEDAVDYLQTHKKVNNVLLSGGDPLTLETGIIDRFLKELIPIKHLDFIRIGTKSLVTFPDRILKDETLVNILKKYSKKKQIYIITQFNHPREITEKVVDAVNLLLNAGIILNNQSVLLKDVNDKADVMAKLQNKLVSIGINPYYIFQCRPVKRVKKNFQVSLYEGYNILESAKALMNGHSKRFKYVLSHRSGKLEIISILKNYVYFKYHEARNPKNLGKTIRKKLNKKACWFDDL